MEKLRNLRALYIKERREYTPERVVKRKFIIAWIKKQPPDSIGAPRSKTHN
jgi:hypothetical protein